MDVVVTVPKTFEYALSPHRGLWAWLDEGDAVGEEWTGEHWGFYTSGAMPTRAGPGDRCYVVCEDRLRGYAPLVEIYRGGTSLCFIRGGGAVAVTIPEPIKGFRGWRYRWWNLSDEVPFPEYGNGWPGSRKE